MAAALLRQAMMAALGGRQRPADLELLDDFAQDTELGPLVPCNHGDTPVASVASVRAAAEALKNAKCPLIKIGGGTRANRREVAKAVHALLAKTRIPFVSTKMGKGVTDESSALYLGCSIKPGDYPNCAVQRADVILNIGYETMEEPTLFFEAR